MSITQTAFKKKANGQFRAFGDSKKAPDRYLKKGISKIEHVRRFINKPLRQCGVTVAALLYGGSVAKKDEVDTPDFDVIIKVNLHLPPFTDVLNTLKTTLAENADKLAIDSESIYTTRFSVHFGFTNGMEVDLLPAVANMSQEKVIQTIEQTTAKYRCFWSSSLVESQVGFLRRQSEFAHCVARISKFWFKSMDFHGAYISGGSTIFELLAVAAVNKQEMEATGPKSVILAFLWVVQQVRQLNKIELSFERNEKGTWKVSEYKGQKNHTVPYIVEPANPTNNMLDTMSDNVFAILSRNAENMETRLRALLQSRKYGTVEQKKKRVSLQVDFEQLLLRLRKIQNYTGFTDKDLCTVVSK